MPKASPLLLQLLLQICVTKPFSCSCFPPPPRGAGRCWEGMSELLPDPFPSRSCPSVPVSTLCAALLFPSPRFTRAPSPLLAARPAQVYPDRGGVNLETDFLISPLTVSISTGAPLLVPRNPQSSIIGCFFSPLPLV